MKNQLLSNYLQTMLPSVSIRIVKCMEDLNQQKSLLVPATSTLAEKIGLMKL